MKRVFLFPENKIMHITEIHIAIAWRSIESLSSLLMSETIVFRKANSMAVKQRWLHLRTALWGLLGVTIAFGIIDFI